MHLNNFVYKFFNNFNIIENDWLFDSNLDKSRDLYKFLGNLFNFIYFRNLTVYLNNFLLNSLDLFYNLLSLNNSNWFLFNFNLFDLLCNIRNDFLNLFDGLFCIRLFFNFYYFFYCSNLLNDLNNFILQDLYFNWLLSNPFNYYQFFNNLITRDWNLKRYNKSFLQLNYLLNFNSLTNYFINEDLFRDLLSRFNYFFFDHLNRLYNLFCFNAWNNLLSDYLNSFINWNFNIFNRLNLNYSLLNDRNLNFFYSLNHFLNLNDSFNYNLYKFRNFHNFFNNSRYKYDLLHNFFNLYNFRNLYYLFNQFLYHNFDFFNSLMNFRNLNYLFYNNFDRLLLNDVFKNWF